MNWRKALEKMKDILIQLIEGKISFFFWYLNNIAIIKPKDASIVQKKCFIVTGWVLVLNVIYNSISCVHYHTIK